MITISITSQNPTNTSASVASSQLTIRRNTSCVFTFTSDVGSITNATIDTGLGLPLGSVFAYVAPNQATLTITNTTSFSFLRAYTVRFKNGLSDVDVLDFSIDVLNNYTLMSGQGKLSIMNYQASSLPFTIEKLSVPDYIYTTTVTGSAVYNTLNDNDLGDGFYIVTIDNAKVPFIIMSDALNAEKVLLTKTMCGCGCSSKCKNCKEVLNELMLTQILEVARLKIKDIRFLKFIEQLQIPSVDTYLASKFDEIKTIAYLIEKTKTYSECYTEVTTDCSSDTFVINKYPKAVTNDCGCS